MKPLKISTPFIASVSGLLVVLAVQGLWTEARPFFETNGDIAARAERIAESPAVPRFSSSTALDLYIDDCKELAGGFAGLELGDEGFQKLIADCHTRMKSIVSAAPAKSEAWLGLAVTSEAAGDTQLMWTALLRSHETGPAQQSLAAERFKIVERQSGQHAADIEQMFDADLAVLVQSAKGSKFLADYYVGKPELRDRITSIAETLPADVQNRLFYDIKAAAAARQPAPQPLTN
ncbi:hypothetical protein [Oryzibacter oryziterrae]|uniref:hypothetical protein n=1 Tax=Oryzibacter oryziterrae TaxID=2766474 RepID=UPI001F38AFC8|nr:hypothetical protein [Oryzibacter oryziterrae]